MLGPRHGSLGSSRVQRQEKQTGAQAASEGAERLGRFGSATKDKSKGGDVVSRIQTYAKEEGERQRKKKADEEAAKKKAASAPKSTEPTKGFFTRMYEKYVSGSKEQ
jgi:hypothetical protein